MVKNSVNYHTSIPVIMQNLTLYIIRKITKLSCHVVNRYYQYIPHRSKGADTASFLGFSPPFPETDTSVSVASLDKRFRSLLFDLLGKVKK